MVISPYERIPPQVDLSNKMPLRVLLIEDDAEDAELIQGLLSKVAAHSRKFRIECASRLKDGLERLASNDFDVVLLDLSLPDSQGLETFLQLKREESKIPVVVLTGLDDETVALEAVRQGAQDYLVKGDVDGKILSRVMTYAIERKRFDDQKDEFLSNVSHELRTPLSIVKGAIENLQDGFSAGLTDKQRQIVTTAHNNIERLRLLINNLLEQIS